MTLVEGDVRDASAVDRFRVQELDGGDSLRRAESRR